MAFIKATWQDKIGPGLSAMLTKSADLQPVFQIFAAKMLRSIEKNFRAGGRRNGIPGQWKPLSARAINQRKQGQRLSPKILIASANLKNSTVTESTASEFAIGSNVPYANRHHQNGVWGAALHVREVVRIGRHKRKVMVTVDHAANRAKRIQKQATTSAALGHSSTLRAKSLAHRTSAREARRTQGKRASTLRNLVAAKMHTRTGSQSPYTAGERKLLKSVAKGEAKRKGLKRKTIWVKPFNRHEDYVLPARPIYAFQPEDLAALSKLLAKHLDLTSHGKGKG